jgi:hypothetical protein
MTAQTSGHGLETGREQSNPRDLARAKSMRTISIVLAIAAFAVLVVGFGRNWPAYYQVPAGLTAWFAVEWQRRCSRRIKALSENDPA